MKLCPKCHFEVSKQDNFCINCGYSFKSAFKRNILIIFSIFLLFIIGLCGLLYRSYLIEQEYLKPLDKIFTCDDNKCHLISNYDKEKKEININLTVEDELVESWQIAVLPKNSKATLVYFPPVTDDTPENSDPGTINYESQPIKLTVGEAVNVDYVLSDKKLSEFAQLKTQLSSENIRVELPDCISTNSYMRKIKKQEYLAQQERNRRANAIRYHLRQLYMNGLISPYTYYDYY